MIRRRRYPGTYDSTTWGARQSDIPSQHMATPDPYDPQFQPDVTQLGQQGAIVDAGSPDPGQTAATTSGPGAGGPSGGPSGLNASSYTRYVFDSRPPMGRDFASPVAASPVSINSDQRGTFIVPAGYIGIVRQIWYRPITTTGPLVDVFGNPTSLLMLSILLNGQPIPDFNLIDCSNGFPCGVEIECFITVPSGSTITGAARYGGVDVTLGATQAGGFNFYGHLLIDDGRTPPLQQGNLECEPTCLSGENIQALKPPPLVLPTPQGPMIVNTPPSSPIGQINCPKPPLVSVNDYLACVIAQGSAINNP